MAFRRKAFVPPKLCRDGSQAVINWTPPGDSKDRKIYLGVWDEGGPAPGVTEQYVRQITVLQREWFAAQSGAPLVVIPAEGITVAAAIQRYMVHLEHDEDGDRRPSGAMSSHFYKTAQAVKPLMAMYGTRYVRELTRGDMDAMRSAMRSGAWQIDPLADHGSEPPGKRLWSRDTTNARMTYVYHFFEWLGTKGYVDAKMHEDLRLRRLVVDCRQKVVRLTPDANWQSILPYTSPQIAAMLVVQRYSGMRPDEVCRMRPELIDRTGEVWIYEPRSVDGQWEHKTAYRGDSRYVALDVQCQEAIASFLLRPANAFCFSPQEAAEWWRENRTVVPNGRSRTTKLYPCELRRREREKKKRKQNPLAIKFAERYTKDTYGRAVLRAIERARRSGVDAQHFTPYMLRHAMGTQAETEHDIYTAASILGNKPSTAQVYAHNMKQKAIEAAKQRGVTYRTG